MEYKEFLNCVTDRLCLRLAPRGLKVTLSSIMKSSDNLRDCVLISKDGKEGSPAIYLDDFYNFYLDGEDIEDIINQIIRIYDENINLLPLDIDTIYDWDRAKDNITCRLMNKSINSKYLEDTVYKQYLDLAIVFYNTFITERKHIYSCKINNEILSSWKISKSQLYEIAMENTKRLFGISMHEVKDAFFDMLSEPAAREDFADTLFDPDRTPMYILTNHIRNQGAINIFMDDVLKSLAQFLNDDLYIIPSSVHEVMIIPKNNRMSAKQINEMIQNINVDLLEAKDILSNHLYIYSREDDRIIR